MLKYYTQYVSKFGKLSSGHRTGKGQFSFQSQRRAMPKNVQTTAQLCSFHMLARLCSESFKLGFSSMWTENFQMYKLGLERARGTRDRIASIPWTIEKAREFQKNIYFCFINCTKDFVWIKTNCGKFLKRWEYQTTLPVSWETCMPVRVQQLEPDMEQWTGSKLGKEYVKAVYCHRAYLIYMQSTLYDLPGWMKHKLESRFQEKYQQPQIRRWYHSNGRKWRGTKEPLDEGERGEWKSWLKTQHSRN